MKITGFTVSFERSKQPASYESAKPSISINGTLDEDETAPEARIRQAMTMAVRVVYNTLSMDVPEGIVEKLGAADAPTGEVERETAKEPAKRGRGRPPKVKEEAPADDTIPDDNAPADEAVKDEEPKAEVIDDAKLMGMTNRATKVIGATGIKAILAEMEVARVGEMNQEQRLDYRGRLDAAIAAKNGG